MSDQLDVVERVLQILQEGRRSSTYKHAVLIGLMDLCVERTDALGWPPTTLTTRELAEKVLALYWPQVHPWDEDVVIRQVKGDKARILEAVTRLRVVGDAAPGASPSLAQVKARQPTPYEQVVRDIELPLIQMPLPKLQKIGGQDTGWLYRISWDDQTRLPSDGTVRAYQRGEQSSFDNRIHLRPEVAMAFVRLHGLLRPFVEQRWLLDVVEMNATVSAGLRDYERLNRHLFGANRASLTRVREPLLKLQGASCFYCQQPVRLDVAEVDHFIPWSRHPDDGLENLVVAHGTCNNDKRDYLAAVNHVERWRERRARWAPDLDQLAQELQWDRGLYTLGAARALYLRLPAETRLWRQGDTFEPTEPRRLATALA